MGFVLIFINRVYLSEKYKLSESSATASLTERDNHITFIG
jgi:hypothetical protein